MKSLLLSVIATSVVLAAGFCSRAEAVERCACRNCRNVRSSPWHGAYYHTAWGMPVALVVPPTAENQSHWGWGVGNTRTTRIRPQFSRNWPGVVPHDRGIFRPTPNWPSDTDQFGVYYVRGPW